MSEFCLNTWLLNLQINQIKVVYVLISKTIWSSLTRYIFTNTICQFRNFMLQVPIFDSFLISYLGFNFNRKSTFWFSNISHYQIGFASKRTLFAQNQRPWIISDPVTKFQKLPYRVTLWIGLLYKTNVWK